MQKYEAIGRLVGGIAHDFNNMIGAILGWAEMGSGETEPATRLHGRFQKIREQSLRAGKLTAQLLAFAGGQILQARKVNLNALVQEEMSLLSRIIGADIEIQIHVAPDLRVTLADPSQLEQVLMNLCLNARDAMAGGGQLTIETQNVELGTEFCHEHAFDRPGSYVLLSVSDTGMGMDAATIEPAASGDHQPRAIERQDQPLRGKETILLAEDHDGLRETAQEMLQGLGNSVLVASDGGMALELFKANSKQIDLIVMDVVMPTMSGPEAYVEMSALRPGVRVIFTTGYTPKARALVSMIEKGAVVLQEPYSLASLSQMVRGALEVQLQV